MDIGLDAKFVKGFLTYLNAKTVHKKNIDIPMVEAWTTQLSCFTPEEFRKAKHQIDLIDKDFPAVADIRDVLNSQRYGTIQTRFIEIITVLESYRQNNVKHKSCDHFLARVIEDLGGLVLLDKLWKPDFYHNQRPQFTKSYNKIATGINNGIIDNSALIVGNRMSYDLGAKDRILLEEAPKKERTPENPPQKRISILSELAKLKQNERRDQKKTKPQKLKFFDRLYQIAIDQDRWHSDIPELHTKNMRCLNEIEQDSFSYCLENNSWLSGYKLIKLSEGLVSDAPFLFSRFYDHQDPLYDRPNFTFMTNKSLEESLLDRMSEEERQIHHQRKRELSG